MIKKFIFSFGVMKLGTGTNSTTRNSVVILLTTGHYILQIVTLSTDNLSVFGDIKYGYYIND